MSTKTQREFASKYWRRCWAYDPDDLAKEELVKRAYLAGIKDTAKWEGLNGIYNNRIPYE